MLFPNRNSDELTYLGTDFEWPAGTDADTIPFGWLYAYRQDELSTPRTPSRTHPVSIQVLACYGTACLPVGHYVAVTHYRLTPSGAAPVVLDFRVEMDVVP